MLSFAILLLASVGSSHGEAMLEQLFDNERFVALRLDADGERAAWFDPLSRERWQLKVGKVGARTSQTILAQDGRPESIFWITKFDLIVVLKHRQGRAIHWVDLKARAAERLIQASGPEREGPRLVSLAAAADGVILASNDARTAWEPDLYRIDVRNGRVALQEKNPGGIYRWYSDGKGLIRLATRWQATDQGLAYELLYRQRSYDAWESVHRYELGQPGIEPLGFDRGSSQILVSATNNSDKAALYRFDPVSRELGDLLFESPDADVGAVIFAGGSSAPAMVEYDAVRPKRAVLDADWRRHLALLDARVGELEYRVQQVTPSGRYALVMAYGDREPGRYLRFDSARGDLIEIGRRLPRLDTRSLRPTSPMRFEARDGLRLSGYVTFPKQEEPAPLVVLVHGGPWSRDRWGFNPLVQYLAGQGMAGPTSQFSR